tara:strand:+ start:199 stop:327 length:129 start_codon:yes stop_codon:yes gene_type:complete
MSTLSEQITTALGSDDWLIVWNGQHLIDADELDARSEGQEHG